MTRCNAVSSDLQPKLSVSQASVPRQHWARYIWLNRLQSVLLFNRPILVPSRIAGRHFVSVLPISFPSWYWFMHCRTFCVCLHRTFQRCVAHCSSCDEGREWPGCEHHASPRLEFNDWQCNTDSRDIYCPDVRHLLTPISFRLIL